jgi:N-formylglutamate deformylase
MKPFFLSIPHSGERVPSEAKWLQGLPEPILMCDVDRFVDRLYEPVVNDLKLTCVRTQWHRYVIDLNRLPDDVDSDSVRGSKNPSGKFTTGLHWVKTTRGATLMAEPISEDLHDQLLKRYFEPFHANVRDTYDFFRVHGAQKIYHVDALIAIPVKLAPMSWSVIKKARAASPGSKNWSWPPMKKPGFQ